MTLTGEGQYNINSLKEIRATNSFLTLDDDIRGCRISGESHDDCTTRLYIDNMRQKCGCLPFSIATQDEAHTLYDTPCTLSILFPFLGQVLFNC